MHHACPKNEFYEYKASAEKPGQMGCMMEHLGCIGHSLGAKEALYVAAFDERIKAAVAPSAEPRTAL